MIFDQILFHNVEELEETEKGYLLRRVCKKVRDGISDGVQNNRFATGVELRFRMTDGAVDLTLSSELVAESATVHIFFRIFSGRRGIILRKMCRVPEIRQIHIDIRQAWRSCGSLRRSIICPMIRRWCGW